MKKIYLYTTACLFFFFFALQMNAQITVAGAIGGKSGTYASLTGNGVNPNAGGGVFAALNSVAQTTANITITFTGNTTENGNNALGNGAWNSISMVSNAAIVRNITGTVANGMIRFNGADKVTIDGRFAGT